MDLLEPIVLHDDEYGLYDYPEPPGAPKPQRKRPHFTYEDELLNDFSWDKWSEKEQKAARESYVPFQQRYRPISPYPDLGEVAGEASAFERVDRVDPAPRSEEPGQSDVHMNDALPFAVPEGFVNLVTNPEKKIEIVERANRLYAGKLEAREVPGKGHGLFAVKEFERHALIAPYPGVEVSREDADSLPEDYNKIADSKFGTAIIADLMDPENPNIAAFANDPGWQVTPDVRKFGPSTKIQPNAQFFATPDGVAVYSIKRIRPGEEVTISYGDDYWKGKREYYPDDIWAKMSKKARGISRK